MVKHIELSIVIKDKQLYVFETIFILKLSMNKRIYILNS